MDLPPPGPPPAQRSPTPGGRSWPPSPYRALGLPPASARVQPPLALAHTGLGITARSGALSLLTCHLSEPGPPNPRQEVSYGLGFCTPKALRGHPSSLSIWHLPLLHRQQWTGVPRPWSLRGQHFQSPQRAPPPVPDRTWGGTGLLVGGCRPHPRRAGHRGLLGPGQLCSPPGRTQGWGQAFLGAPPPCVPGSSTW